jgi:hypothetical protein
VCTCRICYCSLRASQILRDSICCEFRGSGPSLRMSGSVFDFRPHTSRDSPSTPTRIPTRRQLGNRLYNNKDGGKYLDALYIKHILIRRKVVSSYTRCVKPCSIISNKSPQYEGKVVNDVHVRCTLLVAL